MASNSFKASSAVESLEYDFAPYVPELNGAGQPKMVKGKPQYVKGTIPEPSDEQLDVYRKAVGEITREALGKVEGVADMNQLDQIKLIADLMEQGSAAITDKFVQATAEVCGNQPSVDQIRKLPSRHKQAFLGWISGVFLRPEASTPVTMQSVAGRSAG